MKNLNSLGLLGLLMGLILLVPSAALAADSQKADPCAQHKNLDQLNLCRAFEIDKAKTTDH